ncbi:MAG: Ig-like domain-containing protein [Thermoproteota archaeon]
MRLPLRILVFPDASLEVSSVMRASVGPEDLPPMRLNFDSAFSEDGKSFSFELRGYVGGDVAESFGSVMYRFDLGVVFNASNAEMDLYAKFNQQTMRWLLLIYLGAKISIDELSMKVVSSESLTKAYGNAIVPTDDPADSVVEQILPAMRELIESMLSDALKTYNVTLKNLAVNGIVVQRYLLSVYFYFEIEGNYTNSVQGIMEQGATFSPILLIGPFIPSPVENGRVNLTMAVNEVLNIDGNGVINYPAEVDSLVESNKLKALEKVEQIARRDLKHGGPYLPLIQRLRDTTLSIRGFHVSIEAYNGPGGGNVSWSATLARVRPPLEGTEDNFTFAGLVNDLIPLEADVKMPMMDVEVIGMQEAGKLVKAVVPSSAPAPTFKNDTYVKWSNATSLLVLRDVSYVVEPIDREPPTVSSMTPASGSSLWDKKPTISASYSDEDSGVDVSSVMIRLDDADVTSSALITASGFEYTPVGELKEGRHSVTLTLKDRAGNVRTVTWTFEVVGLFSSLWLIALVLAAVSALAVAIFTIKRRKKPSETSASPPST